MSRAIQTSHWSLGVAYGVGALLLISGFSPWGGWPVLGIFVGIALATFLVQGLPGLQARLSSPKDPWVEEWGIIWSRPVR